MAKRISVDKTLFTVTLLLVFVGLVMVFSASAVMAQERFGSPYTFLIKQIIWAVAGLLAMVGLMNFDYHRFKHPAVVFSLLGVTTLLLLAVFFLDRSHNTHRWIRFGGFSFQPSELAKPALILFLAYFLENKLKALDDWRHTLLPAAIPVTLFAGLIVLGAALIIAGLCVDYGRAETGAGPPIPAPASSPATATAQAGQMTPAAQPGPTTPATPPGPDPASRAKTSSTWATLLKSATLYKVAGTCCLFGSVTLATFKFDSLVKFTTPEAPAAIEVSLLHFVDQVAKQPVVAAEQPSAVQTAMAPTNVEQKTALLSPPEDPPVIRATEMDCGRGEDNERFVLKTFKPGKNDELDDQNLIARLNTILDAVETGAKGRELQGFVFIGSSDGAGLGKASREQYGDNATLAKKRAEFVRDQFQEQLLLRKDAPRPHWILVLNPAVPTVRLAIDDGKRFDALRAVQICVAWTTSGERADARF